MTVDRVVTSRETFSSSVLAKAVGTEAERDGEEGVWLVRGNRRRPYRVQFFDEYGFRTCTCTHGLNAGGEAHCYHVAAVWLSQNPGQVCGATRDNWVCVSREHGDERHWFVRSR